MAQNAPRGRILWHELMTTDTAAATAFYTKVTGWSTTPFDANYTMWVNGQTPVGGMGKLSDEAKAMGTPPSWVPYIAVANVDNAVNQATSMGAKTYVPGTDIPMGRFAIMADPQGATFGLFAANGEYPGHDGQPAMGEFSWHELATSDPTAAWHFYHQMFGWDKMQAMDMGPDGIYQEFGRVGVMHGGIYKPKAGTIPSPRWLCYVKVTSADGAASLVTKLGGRVTVPPMEVPGGTWIANCVDPQGAAFAVHGAAPAAKKAPAKPAAKPAAKKAPAKPAAKPAAKKAPAKKKAVAAKKKAAPKKKVAAKKAAPKKKAAKKKPAAKKRPAPKKKAAAKKKPAAKKARRR